MASSAAHIASIDSVVGWVGRASVVSNRSVYMGVSENSVPLNPMVNDHDPYEKWLFHWEYTLFSDKPIWVAFFAFSPPKHRP